MWAWLRELREILNEPAVCQSCEVLKVELAKTRLEKEKLLDKVLYPQLPKDLEQAPEPIPVMPRHKPWRVKQQELEAEDRRQHERILKEFKERTASAEKVMGIENG